MQKSSKALDEQPSNTASVTGKHKLSSQYMLLAVSECCIMLQERPRMTLTIAVVMMMTIAVAAVASMMVKHRQVTRSAEH